MFPGRSILVVEDDLFMQRNFQHVIRSIDPSITVECVETAEEAQTILGKGGPYIYDLVVVDQILGGRKTGIDLWREHKDSFPPCSFILTSGRKWKTIFTSDIMKENHLPSFLPKPFKPDHCRRMMAAMLDLSIYETGVSNSKVEIDGEKDPNLSWPTLAAFYTFLVWSVIIVTSRIDEVYFKSNMTSVYPAENTVIKPNDLPKLKMRLLPEKIPKLNYRNNGFDSAKLLSELSVTTSRINTRAKQILQDTAAMTWGEIDQN